MIVELFLTEKKSRGQHVAIVDIFGVFDSNQFSFSDHNIFRKEKSQQIKHDFGRIVIRDLENEVNNFA